MIDAPQAYRVLFRFFLRQAREDLLSFFFMGVLLPGGLTALLVATNLSRLAAQNAALTGASLLFPIIGVTQLVLPATLARMRERGQLAYFAAFPIERAPLVSALLAAYGMTTVPPVILTALFFAAALHLAPLILVLFLIPLVLGYLVLAAIGALLGIFVPGRTAATSAGVGVALLSGLGVLLPLIPHLPSWSALFRVLPASMVSHIITGFMHWEGVAPIAFPLVALTFLVPISAWLLEHTLPWRVESSKDRVALLADMASKQSSN